MNTTDDNKAPTLPRRASAVRILNAGEGIEQPERRAFLRVLSAQGVSIPAAYLLFNASSGDAQAAAEASIPAYGTKRPTSPVATGSVLRDFADPYVEIIRLLREAAEIEHALMIQYLYAAFSVKPAYAAIAGFGAPNSNDLLGVAVQEMSHLRQVNSLLVALGAAPNLIRQDFPIRHDVYPFEFNLEPLSQKSIAKYMYTEAPPAALDRRQAKSPAERKVLDLLDRVLGQGARINHVGSLYAAVIGTLDEYTSVSKEHADLKTWLPKLAQIQREGEEDHFEFFKRLFLGTHEGFKGHPAIWSLSPNDPAYPARPLPVNPSAFFGHENQIQDPLALSLAWLGNLHYWTILLLSDFAYCEAAPEYAVLAKQQMMGPFMSLARHLPTLGAGMPYEPLSTGYAPCHEDAAALKFIACMVREANVLARGLKDQLPADYPLSVGEETLNALSEKRAKQA
jgi:hypothetical protein